MKYDLVVIGAGASGFAAAITAKKRGKKVLLLEREEKVASKIAITGNGKCNLSATDVSPEKYNRPDFVKDIITEDILAFFDSVGVLTKVMNGKYYPYSETAGTVINAFRKEMGDDVKTGEEVTSLVLQNGVFLLNGKYRADNVALCTGSKATKGKESYGLLTPFGHTYIPPRPSLVPLTTDMTYIKGLNGIRCKVKVSLLSDEKIVASEQGELLFKANGISGICVMNLSVYLARNPGKYTISVDFVYDRKSEEISEFLKNHTVDGIVPKAVAQAVLMYAQKNKISLEKALSDFRIKSPQNGGYQNAQVMCGGLRTEEFDGVKSKSINGLYAGGEVLDVDGECGGYNLHWAFCSGIRIGKSI